MYIEIIVLSQLMDGPKYGYEIKRNVTTLLGKSVEVNNNVLYPMFKRFEKDKIVNKQVKLQEGKPNRYVYHITEVGCNHFYKLISDLPSNLSDKADEFLTRVSFFDKIDKTSIEKIINTRKKHLEARLYLYDQNIVGLMVGNYVPKAGDFAEYEKAKIEIELQMVESLRKKYID